MREKLAAFVVVLLLCQGAARAGQLAVQDAIFSSQLVPLTDTGGAYPLLAGNGWVASGPSNLTNQGFFEGTVVWQNPASTSTSHVDNLPADSTVTQAMCSAVDSTAGQWILPYQGCASMVAETGNQLVQTLTSSVFQANTSYQLTVAIGTNSPSDGPVPDANASIELALFYPGVANQVIVTSTSVFDNTATGLESTHLLDFSTPLITPASAAIGQPIGIYLATSDPDQIGGYFNIDNVRVTAVPEPGSVGMLLAGAMLLRRRRRS